MGICSFLIVLGTGCLISWNLSFMEKKELGHRAFCVAQGLDEDSVGPEDGVVMRGMLSQIVHTVITSTAC